MLMVKTEGVEGVRAAFQVSHVDTLPFKSPLNFIDRNWPLAEMTTSFYCPIYRNFLEIGRIVGDF